MVRMICQAVCLRMAAPRPGLFYHSLVQVVLRDCPARHSSLLLPCSGEMLAPAGVAKTQVIFPSHSIFSTQKLLKAI